jgi:hypothetical protein
MLTMMFCRLRREDVNLLMRFFALSDPNALEISNLDNGAARDRVTYGV